MKKTIKPCVEPFAEDTPVVLLDMNRYEAIERSGAMPDLRHKRSAHLTAAWRFADRDRIVFSLNGKDLSAYRYLSFAVFAVGGAGASFSLQFDGGIDGNGENAYECTLPITKDGWNEYRVELPFMRSIRNPSGWTNIGSVCFDCSLCREAIRKKTVLYLDNLFVWNRFAPRLYTRMSELKGAAAFAKTGRYSIVDRKRIPNALEGEDAKPFEADGIWWLPMAPVAAGIARGAVADNRALTLSFTYRRKKYAFSAYSSSMTVDGQKEEMGFFPAVRGGSLFFPAEFVRNFFHWRQMFTDPMGLIVLSNRRNAFDSVREESTIWQLIADMTFHRPTGSEILDDLHRRFPNATRGRLFASFDDLMQLRKKGKTDETLKRYADGLKKQYGTGSERFALPPVAEGADAEELARCSERMIAFSMLFRLTGDKRYCERAATEAEAAAKLSTWEIGSMTGVGIVALGISVCYDWCHHAWSEARKAIVERGILRLALRPADEAYDGKRRMWYPGSANACVINAGMLAAALTLCDVYPETTHRLLDRILRNAESCFAVFAPDGGIAEGAGAWKKSAGSLALAVAALRRACGTDYGLSSAPGFAATALFPSRTSTQNGIWNYHNCAEQAPDTSLYPLFSLLFGNPVPRACRKAELQEGRAEVSPFDLLFYSDEPEKKLPKQAPDAVYRKAGLAVMRSTDENRSVFAGLHGGSNSAPDGDLDAGSVILEMGGERFLCETGGDESLPLLLRRRAEGQNTFTVSALQSPAPDQNPDAVAPIVEMRGSVGKAYAVVDMTATSDRLLRAKRGLMLTEGRSAVVLQDELTLSEPDEVVWRVWTRSAVTLSRGGRTATLAQNGKTVQCRIGGVAGVRFETETKYGDGLTALVIRISPREKIRLAVSFWQVGEGESSQAFRYEVKPISTWGN